MTLQKKKKKKNVLQPFVAKCEWWKQKLSWCTGSDAVYIYAGSKQELKQKSLKKIW